MSRAENKIIPFQRDIGDNGEETAGHQSPDYITTQVSSKTNSQRHTTRMLTILFIDLVGSAAIKTKSGIHKAQTLELEHKRILLDILEQIRAVYQDNAAQAVRFEGDSYIFIFSNHSHAIHFALLAQGKHREARAGQWPELPEFRIGIETDKD